MTKSHKSYFDIPVLFLIFKRPDTTQKVFEVIREIMPSRLYVAADGPRGNIKGEFELCQSTREIIKKIDWECEVNTLFRDSNLGCKIAVSEAISWFFNHEEMGIILEDDCLPNLNFFSFCKELLLKYKDNNEVMQIGGNHFLTTSQTPNTSYYFSQYPHIWGWATWRRAWHHYDVEMANLDTFLKSTLLSCFKNDKQRIHLSNHLKKTKACILNTWDYQLQYSILNRGGISISPTRNLVINLGFTNQSTHLFLKDSRKEAVVHEELNFPLIHPLINSVDVDLDYLEYQNVYSKDLRRIMRLFHENGIINILKYVFVRFF